MPTVLSHSLDQSFIAEFNSADDFSNQPKKIFLM
jgi:hypothetical protein